MTDLRDIYQEIILDHYRRPRNFSELEGANHEANGHNPLCGDRVAVFLQVEDGTVQDVGFQGSGCAISTASASLMTEAVKGKSVKEVDALFQKFHGLMTGKEEGESMEALGKLEALSGVRQLPVRIKCATLAWHTLQAALQNQKKSSVSTETHTSKNR